MMATSNVNASGPTGANWGGRDTHTCPSPNPADAALPIMGECRAAESLIVSLVVAAAGALARVESECAPDMDIGWPPGQPSAGDRPCMKNSAASKVQATPARIATRTNIRLGTPSS